MGQITVFSRPERRHRWSDEERLEILNEAFAPGGRVDDFARRRDVSTALLYTWRRKLHDAQREPGPDDLAAPGFAIAVLIEDVGVAPSGPQPRDCQDFRVWPGIMGNKESHYVTTQRTCHTE